MKLSVVLYTSKTLSNGEHPIMLRVFRGGKYYYKSLEISCKVTEWNENENKCRKSFSRHANFNKIIQREFNAAQGKIDALIAQKKPFDVSFIFQQQESKRKTILEVVRGEKANYTKYNSIRKYINVENRLKEYKLEHVYVDEVNIEFLENFYSKLKSSRNDLSVYTYMAILRSCLNSALRKKYISENPFIYAHFKYDKQTRKRALSRFDIEKLKQYYEDSYYLPYEVNAFATAPFSLSKRGSEYYTLNLFLSSYFLQGLSLVDMAMLRVKDVVFTNRAIGTAQDFKQYHENSMAMNNIINSVPRDFANYFKRNKRKDAIVPPPSTEKIITIELRRSKTNKLVKIVHKYEGIIACLLDVNLKDKNEDDYLFNIFDSKCDNNITQRNSRLTNITHRCNKRLEQIRVNLNLNIDRLTMYSARHTYASTLYHSGENLNIIAQNMGRDARHMETYLKEFDEDKIITSNATL